MVNGQERTRLPVRSALFKQRTGGLVVRWVTTSEYPLLYVFLPFGQHPASTVPLAIYHRAAHATSDAARCTFFCVSLLYLLQSPPLLLRPGPDQPASMQMAVNITCWPIELRQQSVDARVW
jgi:hypothetical protein